MHLTKSDFKVARTCPTKLFYKKSRYPSVLDDSPYLEFLSDAGYVVETMAKLLFPGGVEMGDWDRPALAVHAIRQAFEAGRRVLFEPTIVFDAWLARIDILRRSEDGLDLIEVKSSGIDALVSGQSPFRGARGGIDAEWRPYLEDVAFQTLVARRAFPEWNVRPFLCVVDKSKAAIEDATVGKFRLQHAGVGSNAWRPEVEFLGDVEALRRSPILAVVDVSDEVVELLPEIEAAAEVFAASLRTDPVQRIPPALGRKCKACEYRMPKDAEGPSGFRECWGALADVQPHVLDLYRVDLLGGKGRDPVQKMAERGAAGLLDVPRELLTGAVAERQRVQLDHTASGTESITPELGRRLAGHAYPHHFIDFEGSRLAIPYHAGMRPYEQAAFQWSCHTVNEPAATLSHSEWLNDADAFPNFEFARTLMRQIGDTGTVYIWSSYEVTILREIRRQMTDYGERDGELAEWLDRMSMPGNSRIVDLCALAKEHYFHPAMKGSLSIKHVLPAIWGADARVRSHPAFARYAKPARNGGWLNPYEVLPALPIGEKDEIVKEGTGAMRVYQEMMFGASASDLEKREIYRRLLLQYCELDTAAMVMIWMHWREVAPR
ncbi:MAG: DUF2779 domain-containing protein [Verrucomicrobiales bacterium]|nr:DUF2779 domain-containing protein [Verrucomicrobiales bacterium]